MDLMPQGGGSDHLTRIRPVQPRLSLLVRLAAYEPMPDEPTEAMAWEPTGVEGIWINHNPQAGREMNNHHPFLVLSPAPFHAVGQILGFVA